MLALPRNAPLAQHEWPLAANVPAAKQPLQKVHYALFLFPMLLA
jgi:hypothetical protein